MHKVKIRLNRVVALKNLPPLLMVLVLILVFFGVGLHWRNPKSDLHFAVIIQTCVFGLGLLLTIFSLCYLRKANNFLAEQMIFTKGLLEVERARDQQANLFCAWAVIEFFPEDLNNILKGDVLLSNSSSLPIYDVKVELVFRRGLEVNVFEAPIGFLEDDLIKVVSPRLDSSRIWHIDGSVHGTGEMATTKKTIFRSEQWDANFLLSEQGVTINDIRTLGVRIQFRCADGSIWTRDEDGSLKLVKPSKDFDFPNT